MKIFSISGQNAVRYYQIFKHFVHLAFRFDKYRVARFCMKSNILIYKKPLDSLYGAKTHQNKYRFVQAAVDRKVKSRSHLVVANDKIPVYNVFEQVSELINANGAVNYLCCQAGANHGRYSNTVPVGFDEHSG